MADHHKTKAEDLTAPFKNTPLAYDYDILAFLGRGSYGQVYLLQRKLDGMKFAVKVFRKSEEETPSKKRRENFFRQECDTLKNIRHQNVVKFQEFFENTRFIYLVVEYCEGGDLKSYIRKINKKHLSEDDASSVVKAVLKGLSFIHNKCNIIHRDIKMGRKF
jgi:calcium-dependent protein kinase